MSDKTTAAIAAEQSTDIMETAAPAEELPATSLEELEQFDLGTVVEDERPAFRITDDRCADWAIRKIAEERSEYNRLKELADQQKAASEEKVEAARRRLRRHRLPHELSGRLFPHRPAQGHQDDREIPAALRHPDPQEGRHQGQAGRRQAGAVAEGQRLRRLRQDRGECQVGRAEEAPRLHRRAVTIAETGEIVEGVTAYEAPDTFTVDI